MKISITRKILRDQSLSLNDFSLYLRSDKGKWVHRTELSRAELDELISQARRIRDQVDTRED